MSAGQGQARMGHVYDRALCMTMEFKGDLPRRCLRVPKIMIDIIEAVFEVDGFGSNNPQPDSCGLAEAQHHHTPCIYNSWSTSDSAQPRLRVPALCDQPRPGPGVDIPRQTAILNGERSQRLARRRAQR